MAEMSNRNSNVNNDTENSYKQTQPHKRSQIVLVPCSPDHDRSKRTCGREMPGAHTANRFGSSPYEAARETLRIAICPIPKSETPIAKDEPLLTILHIWRWHRLNWRTLSGRRTVTGL